MIEKYVIKTNETNNQNRVTTVCRQCNNTDACCICSQIPNTVDSQIRMVRNTTWKIQIPGTLSSGRVEKWPREKLNRTNNNDPCALTTKANGSGI